MVDNYSDCGKFNVCCLYLHETIPPTSYVKYLQRPQQANALLPSIVSTHISYSLFLAGGEAFSPAGLHSPPDL